MQTTFLQARNLISTHTAQQKPWRSPAADYLAQGWLKLGAVPQKHPAPLRPSRASAAGHACCPSLVSVGYRVGSCACAPPLGAGQAALAQDSVTIDFAPRKLTQREVGRAHSPKNAFSVCTKASYDVRCHASCLAYYISIIKLQSLRSRAGRRALPTAVYAAGSAYQPSLLSGAAWLGRDDRKTVRAQPPRIEAARALHMAASADAS